MTPELLRAWWWTRQGLDGSLRGASAADVLAKAGWSRSVGGQGPYLAIHARSGAPREAVDRELAALGIHELPSARGCVYVVPSVDYAVALRASLGNAETPEIEMAKKHLGVTDAEVDRLCQRVLEALDARTLDPKELKDALGDAVRNLGDAGKKKGMTTTLPLALGLLQSRGEIRRVPLNARLDGQRFAYARWSPSPLAGVRLSTEEIARELATRFFRWAAPATVAQLAWWAGLSKKAAKAAAEAAGVAPIAPGDDRLASPEDVDALKSLRVPTEPRYSLVGSLDNLAHLRREVAPLLDPIDAEKPVYTEKGSRAGASLLDLPHHAIVDRGRIVGLWDYDGHAQQIVWAAFVAPDAAMRAAVAETEAFVRDQLGDARSFSLDSIDSRKDRLEALKSYSL